MVHQKVYNVRVFDNGLRSFLPPCFCYQLYGADNAKQATVSEVLFPNQDVTLQDCIKCALPVSGQLVEYDCQASRTKGLRLIAAVDISSG